MPALMAGFLCLGLLIAPSVGADTLRGRVVAIADGDTVTVLDVDHVQHKVRLSGVDAPEKAQPFGTRSRQSLGSLAFGKTLNVDWSKHDRYGRIVGKLVDDQGVDLNLEQVRRGMAWHYKQYQREQPAADRTAYALVEDQARAARVGLWADPAPVPPWEYRKAKRASGKAFK